MKITAKLAYSQLRINRSRTFWTLAGIVLSSALISAVCSFAASCSTLAVMMSGENFGGTFTGMMLFPAGILSGIIAAMSFVVITNAFRASAGKRREQFGILKSVGASKRQITMTVMYESILLSAAAVPPGIIIGLIIAFAGVRAANHFLGEINSLTQTMIREVTFAVEFRADWQAIIISALISFLTVLFSAWLPARKAARTAAIDSIRGAGEVRSEAEQVRTGRLMQKLFGFEGTLAAKNIKRSRRSFRACTASLAAGSILFVSLSSLSEQVSIIEKMIYPDVRASVMADYTSGRDTSANETSGMEETVFTAPVSSEKTNAVTEKLREYENTEIFGAGSDMETYRASVPKEMIAPQMAEVYFSSEQRDEYEVSAEIIIVDKKNYELLCERAGVPAGSNILLNHYSYNDNGKAAAFAPFQIKERSLKLIRADGSAGEVYIHGFLLQEDIPSEILPPNANIFRLIVPQGDTRDYIWYADPADEDGFIDYANAVINEAFPQGEETGYTQAGFSTRVFKMQDYMRIMNTAVILVKVFVYSFTAMLLLIGLTSVISTLSANVHMRGREFAVLQSAGMSRSGLNRMLGLESVICSARALMIGLPVSVLLTYLINRPVRAVFPVPYRMPWASSAWCAVIIFMITWITIRYSASGLYGRNIAETIRSER